MVNGKTARITAAELPGNSGGTFAWSTTSTKIRLENPTAATVVVHPLAQPSAGREAEVVQVTRTCPGCPTLTKTVKLTVASVAFSKAAGQKFGYDDFDTPANANDDHVCVKMSADTLVHVEIKGGALGTDFNFVGDDPTVFTAGAPPGSASFDLQINGGAHTKKDTALRAKSKCACAEAFAAIQVHVYKEKLVDVVVAKIHDSTVPATGLRYPTANYASCAPRFNGKLKEGVVRFNVTNFDPANGLTNVHYDLNGDGMLTYDIAAGGGTELAAIRAAMSSATGTRIAIVRNMRSCYFLAAAAAVGDRSVRVTAGSVFQYPGFPVGIGNGATKEPVTVASSAGSTVNFTAPLTKAHAAGEPLEFPAGGWGCDPILVIEGSATQAVIEWTIVHETGHTALLLKDVVDATTIMHFQQAWTDYRLRFCLRTKKHEAGTENQWEKIPR
jgi:hypothetical protein